MYCVFDGSWCEGFHHGHVVVQNARDLWVEVSDLRLVPPLPTI